MLDKEPGRLSIFVTNVSSTEQLASSFAETGSGTEVGNLNIIEASETSKRPRTPEQVKKDRTLKLTNKLTNKRD